MNTPTIHVIYITVKSAPVCLALAAVLLLAIPFSAAARPYGLLPDYEMNPGWSGHQVQENIFQVNLVGITTYEAGEIFQALLTQTPGVIEAKRYFFRIVPDAPHVLFAARSNELPWVYEYPAAPGRLPYHWLPNKGFE